MLSVDCELTGLMYSGLAAGNPASLLSLHFFFADFIRRNVGKIVMVYKNITRKFNAVGVNLLFYRL